MNSLHLENQPLSPAFHTIGFLEHGTISQEVKMTINGNKCYIISEILPSGHEMKREVMGRDILKDCSKIFGNWLHGFIVREKGDTAPIFIYKGPIPTRIFDIISPGYVH